MKRTIAAWRTKLILGVCGVLVLGAVAVSAQDEPIAAEDLVIESASELSADVWDSLDTVRIELQNAALEVMTDEEAVETAEAVSSLLDGEGGIIDVLANQFGITVPEVADALAIVEDGTEADEVLALAHLVLASDAASNTATDVDLLVAGQHVEQAYALLANH